MSQDTLKEELADEGINSGVEKEPDGENFTSKEPFDPASISLSSKIVALDTVLRRIKNETIQLAPDFQRNYVWDIERKSLLIESMMLRIPLPMFYVSEDKNGVWEVVDGLQRLTTIKDFLLGVDSDGKGFKLKGLEFWADDFDGKDFFTIANKMQMPRIINNILEAELSFTIINPDTPEKVKRNIFKRINTGGMRLSMQEIRHALYQGEATALLKELVTSKNYKDAINDTVKDDRMAGRELILRYMSFHIRGYTKFSGDMDSFLSDTMRYINKEIDINVSRNYNKEKIISDFNKALYRCKKVFGGHAFRRSFVGQRKTPINKSLFDVWMYIFSRVQDKTFESIIENHKSFIEKYEEILNNYYFSDSIGRHGSDLQGVKVRYKEIINLVQGFQNA